MVSLCKNTKKIHAIKNEISSDQMLNNYTDQSDGRFNYVVPRP